MALSQENIDANIGTSLSRQIYRYLDTIFASVGLSTRRRGADLWILAVADCLMQSDFREFEACPQPNWFSSVKVQFNIV